MTKIENNYDPLQDMLQLNSQQRGVLAAYIAKDGFALIMRLWRDEVRKFTERALNSNTADDKESLEALRKAKVAAQLFQGWVERLNHEVSIYEAQLSDVGTAGNPENNVNIDELA